MTHSRRHFLKTVGIGAGALAAPGWISVPEFAAAAQATQPGKDDLAEMALAAAKSLGASYADIRVNRYRVEEIYTREQQVRDVSRSESYGFGVRTLVKGSWGFAASGTVSAAEVRRVTQQAVEMARAHADYQRRPITLVPAPKVVATWKSAFRHDPFEVPLDEKIRFLLKLNEIAMQAKGVGYVDSFMHFVNEQKFFASTDGSRIEQYLIRSFPSFEVSAVDRESGDFQTRRSIAGPQMTGYEYIEQYPWLAEAQQAGEEAVAKLDAKPVEPGQYDLVLHPSHLWLTIHESVGHSTELDRALGWEANYAGTSFLTPDKTGKLQFGSRLVNFVADRTQPSAMATVGYDDEGVAAQRWHLVKDGVFVDWQTTRDLAPLVGRKTSYGCLHADSWASVPMPRMPNVSLEPASDNVSLDNLVADVENGILIYGDGSYSIDQQRYNFQFGGQTFWEIKKGKIAGMLRDVAYQARTTDFWGSCDGLGGRPSYSIHGSFYDGKGQPPQVSSVSHGCPVARFRRINVLNTNTRRG